MLRDLLHEAAVKLAHTADRVRKAEKRKEQQTFAKTILLSLLAYFLNFLTSKLQEAYDATGNSEYLAEAAISDLIKVTAKNDAVKDFRQTIRDEKYKDKTSAFEAICLIAAAATNNNLLSAFEQQKKQPRLSMHTPARVNRHNQMDSSNRPKLENHRAGKISHAFKRGGPR